MEPRSPDIECLTLPVGCIPEGTPGYSRLLFGVPPFTLNVGRGVGQYVMLPMTINWPEIEATSQTLRFVVPALSGGAIFKPTKIALAFDGLRFGHAAQLRWSIASPSSSTSLAMQSGPPCILETSFGSNGFLAATGTAYDWQTKELKHNKWGDTYVWASHGAPVVSNTECPSTPFGCVSSFCLVCSISVVFLPFVHFCLFLPSSRLSCHMT